MTIFTCSLKATMDLHKPKVNSARFGYPYKHINHMDNTNADTHLVDAHVDHNIEDDEEEEHYEDVNENTITEEEL